MADTVAFVVLGSGEHTQLPAPAEAEQPVYPFTHGEVARRLVARDRLSTAEGARDPALTPDLPRFRFPHHDFNLASSSVFRCSHDRTAADLTGHL